ncbi:MAG: nicotinate-nucleotide adenylyltransferase [Alphaproteobacteria bacterium]|nr:nicotinate-nucleotide adenylyltransferase [Alphaproteobacteria bacterium]
MDKLDPDAFPPPIVALARAGGRIGLLGGSFNPAHQAHRHIGMIALRRLKLDAVWWLVAPQNPLKSTVGMAPLERRLTKAREVAAHPDIHAGTPEEALGTRFTIDTIEALVRQFPKARFVWLMGGDSLASFHHWRRWKAIVKLLPIAVVARPGFTVRALASPAALYLENARVADDKSASLADMKAPAWTFIRERLDPTSATALRQRGVWR